MFVYYIIVVLLAFILFFGVKFAKKGEFHEDALGLETSKGIQGVSAICIVLHHLTQNITNNGNLNVFKMAGPLGIFEDIGVIFVGIFFFFSGYGLIKSLMSKPDYLKGFLKKRLIKVLVPTFVCIFIFLFVYSMINGKMDLLSYIKYGTGYLLINSHMWYIVEIVVLYLAFYIIFKFFYKFLEKEYLAYIFMGAFTIGLVVFSVFQGHCARGDVWFKGEWWFNATLLFFIGMLIARFGAKIKEVLKNPWLYYGAIVLCLGLTILFAFLTNHSLSTIGYYTEYMEGRNHYLDKFCVLAVQLPMIIFAVLTLALVMLKVKFGNPIMKFIGSISLELYLCHNIFLSLFRNRSFILIRENELFTVAVLACSIILAYIIHLFVGKIMAFINHNVEEPKPEPKNVNYAINCMRLLACFLVVAIHIPFKGTLGDIVITIAKVAVPFFLVVCGYFCYREDPKEFSKRLVKQIKKLFILVFIMNLFYMLVLINMETIVGTTYGGNLDAMRTIEGWRDFFIFNENQGVMHLWYLGSLLYALIIAWILTKIKIFKYVVYFLPVLVIPYIVLTYVGKIDFYQARNALFVAVPYFAMGCLIRKYEDKLKGIHPAILFSLFALLIGTSMIELFCYKTTNYAFVSIEILVYVLVVILIKYPNIGKNTIIPVLGSKYSLFIYLAHPIFLFYIWNRGIEWTWDIVNMGPIIIFIITLLLAIICYGIKGLFVRKAEIKYE